MNTVTPQQIVEKAREYIGTPWHHGARVKGVGVDCIGLLVCVSHELGVPVEDELNYTAEDEFLRLVGHMRRYCDLLPENAPIQAGDILIFRSRGMYNHCAFANGEGGMIHAYHTTAVDKVVEHDLDTSWMKRIAAVFRYKGVTTQAEAV